MQTAYIVYIGLLRSVELAFMQEVEHFRQHAGDNGEVLQELGRDRGRTNGSAARGETTN